MYSPQVPSGSHCVSTFTFGYFLLKRTIAALVTVMID